MSQFRNILIIQLRQLGDILLTTPVIRALKQYDPTCRVSFLSHPMGKLILDDNPSLDEHLIFPASGVLDQIQCLKKLHHRKFDLVLDFMGNPRSGLATLLTQARSRVGFAAHRSWAYNFMVPRVSGEDYIVKEKFRMLAALGISADDMRLMLPWGEKHYAAVAGFYDSVSERSSNSLRVVLSPTHRRADRRWPGEHWSTLADSLVKELGAQVFWVWGPGEGDEVQSIQKECQLKTYLAPKTSFRELAAFIAQSDIFIGNSNGPSHVAVAVNTPSIQLHGPTDALSWSPVTKRHQIVAKEFMSEISVQSVLDVAFYLAASHFDAAEDRNRRKSSEDVWTTRPHL